MFQDSDEIVAAAEEIAKNGDVDGIPKSLRRSCLDDFAELLLELLFRFSRNQKFIPSVLENPTD
jgi:hypothetical protein